MKLSEATEHALLNGFYTFDNPYMCNAMHTLGLTRHVQSIEVMLDTISPGNFTLWGALYDAGLVSTVNEDVDGFNYTSQLYVWWVFDLKRKGL